MCTDINIFHRYSAVRRQFGPTPHEELPVLEYQLQVCYIYDIYIMSMYLIKLCLYIRK